MMIELVCDKDGCFEGVFELIINLDEPSDATSRIAALKADLDKVLQERKRLEKAMEERLAATKQVDELDAQAEASRTEAASLKKRIELEERGQKSGSDPSSAATRCRTSSVRP